MIEYNIPLVVATVVWIAVVWRWMLPLLSMPIAKIKREFVLFLSILGSVSLVVEWCTRQDMRLVSMISLLSFVSIALGMVVLLRRLDYYIEELLQELFVLAVSSAGVSLVTSIWYWGIASNFSLVFLRIIVVSIPLILFAISWLVAKQRHSLWSAGIYVLLVAIKWLTFSYWGIWTIILLLLYSTLVGYVANWMMTTTYAEKVLAWDVAPAKVWGLLVLSAGMLVIFF